MTPIFYQGKHANKTVLFYSCLRLLILGGVLILCAGNITYGQANNPSVSEQTFSLSIKAPTTFDALIELGKTTGYNFSYNANIVKDTIVNLKVRKEPLSAILQQLLGDQFYSYEVVGNQIVLLPKPADQLKTAMKLEGVLYGADNHEPVQFANIGIANKGYGTVSNAEGQFALLIDSANSNDTLVVSALGYLEYRKPVEGIKQQNQIIFLRSRYIPIQEVIIRQADPEKIVAKAIEAIEQNYITGAIRMESFYREYLLKNKALRSLYEAYVTIYKPAYSSLLNDQVKVEKALDFIDSTRRDSVTVKLKGGLTNVSALDIAKTLPYYFNPQTLHTYKYNIEDIVHFNNNDVYVIHFRPDNNYQTPPFKGRLYINLQSLALVKAEIELEINKDWEDIGIQVFKKTAKLKTQLRSHAFMVQYSELNGRYYMKYFRSEINLKVKGRKNLFHSDYSLISELVSSSIDTSDVKSLSFRERINPKTIFSDEIKDYPNDFWHHYNTLPPEKNMLRDYFAK